MLNLECQTVYDVIRSIAGENDVYKIVEADEIIDKMPKEIALTKVQLSAIIRELKDREYITVKYFTPDEYCLLVVKRIDERAKMQQAEVVQEQPEQAQKEPKAKKKDSDDKLQKAANKVGVFFASLIGAFVGSGIVATITALIIKFVIMA